MFSYRRKSILLPLVCSFLLLGSGQVLASDPEDDPQIVENRQASPWCAYGRVDAHYGNRVYIGTGVLIHPRVVLTAGHVIYDKNIRRKQPDKVQFLPLKHGHETPHVFDAKETICHPLWFSERNSDFDLGLLILKKKVFKKKKHLCFGIPRDEGLEDQVNIAGYPLEKGGQQLWLSKGGIENILEEILTYEITTLEGQSGSGITLGNAQVVYGVHSQGPTESDPFSKGVKLTNEKCAFMTKGIIGSKEVFVEQ